MANYDFYTYSPKALVYDPNTGSFQLDPDYKWQSDRNLVKLKDNDQKFDGDYSEDEVGEDKNQTAKVYDGKDKLIASGQVYVEQVAWLEAPNGSYITLDRIEIAGVNIGYLPSHRLQEGVQYKYLGATNVDDGDDDNRSDSRREYDYYETNSVPCFGPDAMIATDDGQVPVQWLKSGDRVLTMDHGFQEIRWVGRYRVSIAEINKNPAIAPVELPTSSGKPLVLSQQHRVFLTGERLQRYLGVNEALCAAKFLNATRQHRPSGIEFSYYHVLCDRHEIVKANGVWVETLLLGEQAELSNKEAGQALPDLAAPQIAARYCLKAWEAQLLPKSNSIIQASCHAEIRGIGNIA